MKAQVNEISNNTNVLTFEFSRIYDEATSTGFSRHLHFGDLTRER